MSGKAVHHVLPDTEGGWKVVKEGAKRATRIFSTKREAVRRAREISRRSKGNLIIHRRDGSIQEGRSYHVFKPKRTIKGSYSEGKHPRQEVQSIVRGVHVLRTEDGRWGVKRGGASRLSKRFERKEEAVSYAQEVSERSKSRLVVHEE